MPVTSTRSVREGSASATLPLLLRDREVAELLGISKSKAYLLMTSGALPGVVRIGRCIRLSRESLERWIHEQAA